MTDQGGKGGKHKLRTQLAGEKVPRYVGKKSIPLLVRKTFGKNGQENFAILSIIGQGLCQTPSVLLCPKKGRRRNYLLIRGKKGVKPVGNLLNKRRKGKGGKAGFLCRPVSFVQRGVFWPKVERNESSVQREGERMALLEERKSASYIGRGVVRAVRREGEKWSTLPEN